MIDTSNWKPFFKYGDDGSLCLAQQTYEPLISPDRTMFCANYNWQNKYQRTYEDRELYTAEVCDWFFENELYHLTKFKGKSYVPNIVDIDYTNKKVFFEWNGYTFNEMLHHGEAVEWENQLKYIMLDLHKEGTYKLTMYPHCHFLDTNGVMKTIDWYGCISVRSPFIQAKYMNAIVHETARFRLDETGGPVNNLLNLETMFKRSLSTHVLWRDKNMYYIYKEIFTNE